MVVAINKSQVIERLTSVAVANTKAAPVVMSRLVDALVLIEPRPPFLPISVGLGSDDVDLVRDRCHLLDSREMFLHTSTNLFTFFFLR